jgi:NAD(P)H-flavin reductase
VNPLLPEPARIVEARACGADIRIFRLRIERAGARARFAFVPGQFNMLYVPGVGEVAISISSDPDEEELGHTVRIVGRVTRVMAQLGVGDVLGVRGPYGNGWPLEQARGSDLLFVTGGLGCAPVAGAIDYVLRRRASYGRVTILHGVKKPADLVERERFEAWRAQPDTRVLITSDRPDLHWRDRTGVVTELFDELEFDPLRTLLLLCGPEVMMRYATRHLAERGLPDRAMFLALERNMRCAVGLCGRCQLGPAFVCKDGPIFALPRIARYLRTAGL